MIRIGVRQFSFFLASVLLIVSIAGCGGTSGSKLAGSGAAKTVTALAISPSTATVAVGATAQFAAMATYSDSSTANVTNTATWTTAKATLAMVNSSGMLTGVAVGSTTVTATLNGVSAQATVTVPVAAKTLTSITVSPASTSLAVGATQQLTAMATYDDNSTANVTTTANWTATSSAIASVNSSGVATGVAAGSTTIMASLSGVSGRANITVTAAAARTITSIAVSPANPSVAVGATQQLTATATYNDNSTANVTTTAAWKSGSAAVVTVSAGGLATAVASGTTTVTASLNGVNGTAMITVPSPPKTITSIAVSASNANVAMGSTQQFTATATYSDNSTADVTTTAAWTTANSAVASINSSGLLTGEAAGSTTITATLNGVSGNTGFIVTIAPGTGVNLATWQVDNNRSGLNAGEQSLSPANVNPQMFGKLFSYLVDGYVYGEPLLVSNVTINGASHNVLYAATENDSVYAFDADSYGNGAPLWKVSLLQTGEGPIAGAISPYEGVTSTPVIDLTTNTIYVVTVEHKPNTKATFRLNALDIRTGAQKFGGPVVVQASVPGTNAGAVNGIVSLTTECIQRAALLLANGTVYIGFGSCQNGWLLAYNATTLAQIGVFNASPNLNSEGVYGGSGGIWMGGGGPATDSSGNVYVTTGDGPWDGQTAWGESMLKFSPQLQMEDYFTPQDYEYMDCNDADLASGGLLLIPGSTQALAGGKTGRLYLVNTASMGKEQAGDAGVTQKLWFESDLINTYTSTCTDASGTYSTNADSYENFGTAAYFNGSVYLGVTPSGSIGTVGIRQFAFSGTLTPGDYTALPGAPRYSYGTTPFISAHGTSNGILWMIDHGSPLDNPSGSAPTNATLRAYDPTNLKNELYNSGINAADVPGYGIKFSSPVVANGKVYISTGHDQTTAPSPRGEIDVYGLK
jgi:uncharacterized protein YjdB